MRLLLDTHVFFWYISADSQLPAVFRDAIRDPANEVYLSAASVWEAVIKYTLGKLPLPETPAERGPPHLSFGCRGGRLRSPRQPSTPAPRSI
jgi:PIN domain nuclease of toxin-antitoxin system